MALPFKIEMAKEQNSNFQIPDSHHDGIAFAKSPQASLATKWAKSNLLPPPPYLVGVL